MASAGNRGAVTPQGQARTAITNVTQMSNWQSAERTTPNGQARTAITNVTQMSNWQSAERTTPNGQARTGRTRRVRRTRTL